MAAHYRIIWKRAGLPEKRKVYKSLKRAERRVALLGPEPWLAFDKGPNDYACCPGWECGCHGQTLKERLLEERKSFPPIEYIRMERRAVVVKRDPWAPYFGDSATERQEKA